MIRVGAQVVSLLGSLTFIMASGGLGSVSPANQPSRLSGREDTAPAQAVERVSVNSDGSQTHRWSGFDSGLVEYVDVSASGRFVAFASSGRNLVPGDSNKKPDIFVRDTLLDTTTRVSVASNGQQGNRRSYLPQISADGRYVSFSSRSSNLAAEDDNRSWDAFVHDRLAGITQLVSVRPDGQPITQAPDQHAWATSISDDGQRIVFKTWAPGGPSDRSEYEDVFVRIIDTDTTVLVSQRRRGPGEDESADEGAISGNGRYVMFTSIARNLLPSHLPVLGDIYVRDLKTGTIRTASAGWGNTPEDGHSWAGELSRDGTYMAFGSTSRNLTKSPSPREYTVVYVRNLRTGKTWRVASGSDRATISANGSSVAFSTDVPLVDNDLGEAVDVYSWSRITKTFRLVNLRPDGTQSLGDSYGAGDGDPAITADGTAVAFSSGAPDLVTDDTNGTRDVFLAPVP